MTALAEFHSASFHSYEKTARSKHPVAISFTTAIGVFSKWGTGAGEFVRAMHAFGRQYVERRRRSVARCSIVKRARGLRARLGGRLHDRDGLQSGIKHLDGEAAGCRSRAWYLRIRE